MDLKETSGAEVVQIVCTCIERKNIKSGNKITR